MSGAEAGSGLIRLVDLILRKSNSTQVQYKLEQRHEFPVPKAEYLIKC